MFNGQLSSGVVQITAPETNELLGYAHTEGTAGGQRQRWLLYRNPGNKLQIQAAPAEMARLSLSDWRRQVPLLWRPRSYYVEAQTDLYFYGREYYGRVWDSLPPESEMPAPTYPALGGALQLDPTGTRLLEVLQRSAANEIRGYAFTKGGLDDESNAEYWLLPSGYLGAGAAAATAIVPGTTPVATLGEFLNAARGAWAPGAVLAITGCLNYVQKDRAPAEL